MNRNISFWECRHFFSYDVIVVGAGIVGLHAAFNLLNKEPKLRVAVLEAGFLPSGASTKNAGFACFGSISELIEQEASIGTAALHTLIKKRWLGLRKLRENLGDDLLDYRNYGGYELFRPSEAALSTACTEQIGHFNELVKDVTGQAETFRIATEKIARFGFKGIDVLLENKCEAQIDPGKMMRQLNRIAVAGGAQILNRCKVNGFTDDTGQITVHTNEGDFSCRKLIVATNAFAPQLLPEIDVKPGRGQVLITKPIKDLRVEGTFHYEKGFYYFRNIDGRLLLGGGRNLAFEEESTLEPGTSPRIQTALKNLMEEVILPGQTFEIEQSWSGVMAFGSEVGPYIAELRPGIFCATRCSGMGIAIGAQTGEDLANLALAAL